jgi:hypothetical protein
LSIVLFSVQATPEHESSWRGVFRCLGAPFDELVVDGLIEQLGADWRRPRGEPDVIVDVLEEWNQLLTRSLQCRRSSASC